MKKIVIFASGNGSNAESIMQFFKNSNTKNVVGLLSNNLHAKVLDKAKTYNIATHVFTKNALNNGDVLQVLQKINPDLIVLAGFLLQFPINILEKFSSKVINIHPALLPNYGGKGMYGMNIHNKIFENKEKISGITIHYVNENYDEGEFILQESVNIENCKSAEEIAFEVLKLEHQFFAKTIDKLL